MQTIKNLFASFPIITLISDTHGHHERLNLGKGDLLIHAGDITEYGMEYEVLDFMNWMAKQDYKHKIFIAGNHDLYFENITRKERKALIPEGLIYLENESVTIHGIKIFASPVTPYFYGMAFNRHRGQDIQKVWNKIPKNTDILITHGPPLGILDNRLGCEDLLSKVNAIQPKLHTFGHIHEAQGMVEINNTVFVNAGT